MTKGIRAQSRNQFIQLVSKYIFNSEKPSSLDILRQFLFVVLIPPLIDLMYKEDSDINSALNQFRWMLLMWLLSISSATLENIKSIPKAFLLPVVTLIYLVQVIATYLLQKMFDWYEYEINL